MVAGGFEPPGLAGSGWVTRSGGIWTERCCTISPWRLRFGTMPRVYLDACCVNRPFDDQSQGRVRLEAEAVLLTVSLFGQPDWIWIGSSVLRFELAKNPDPDRRAQAETFARGVQVWVALGAVETGRATELEALGFATFDALHLASAESGRADLFLTTDDALLRVARRHPSALRVRIMNPLSWFEEFAEHDQDNG